MDNLRAKLADKEEQLTERETKLTQLRETLETTQTDSAQEVSNYALPVTYSGKFSFTCYQNNLLTMR